MIIILDNKTDNDYDHGNCDRLKKQNDNIDYNDNLNVDNSTNSYYISNFTY